MTPDEQRRADLAELAITLHLGDRLSEAQRSATVAAGAADSEARQAHWDQAGRRLQLWLKEHRMDNETATEVSNAFLQAMEDASELVRYAGDIGDAESLLTIRQRAAVTREWLRDQGYDIPEYAPEPGL